MPSSLGNFYDLAQTETNVAVVIFNIAVAFALACVVVWVWRRTHRGLSFTQSFAVTIIMLAPLAATVMMIVRNNLIGAFALLGAFSLIRFRTIIKETRDVAFLFFSLTIGVSVGTGNYAIALTATAMISAIVLGFHRWGGQFKQSTGYILTIETDLTASTTQIEQAAKQYSSRIELLHARTGQSVRSIAYGLHLTTPENSTVVVDAIKRIPGVTTAYLITGKDAVEY